MLKAITISERLNHSACYYRGMKTLASRIAHYRALAQMSQGQLASACGWASQSRIGNYEAGTREPKIDDVNRIAKALSIKPEQLLISTPLSKEETRTPSATDYAMIPMYSASGQCGNGYLNDHIELKGSQAFNISWLTKHGIRPESSAVMCAVGDSMEPYIFDGDSVLFDMADVEPKHRQVYVIRRPDCSLSIKRLVQQLNGDWIVKSDNPEYEDERVSSDSIHELPFLGRVRWRGGNLD